MSAATPGQALSPDPADFAYHVRATAFNVLTGKMAGDEWSVPRSERDAIARAVVDAIEPLIRADERAAAAQEPHAAPGPREVEEIVRTAVQGFRGCRSTGPVTDCPGCEKHVQAILSAVSAHLTAPREPQPAPELAASDGDCAECDTPRVVCPAHARSQPSPEVSRELAAAMRESRLRAEVITEILDAFSPSGSGHTARVGMIQIAKWRTRAGLTS